MGHILRKIKELFYQEKDGGLSVLDIKPKYKSNEEYLAQLESEINEMLKTSGKTEAQVYEYIEGSNVYNEEIEQIYSKLHTFNSFKHFHKA